MRKDTYSQGTLGGGGWTSDLSVQQEFPQLEFWELLTQHQSPRKSIQFLIYCEWRVCWEPLCSWEEEGNGCEWLSAMWAEKRWAEWCSSCSLSYSMYRVPLKNYHFPNLFQLPWSLATHTHLLLLHWNTMTPKRYLIPNVWEIGNSSEVFDFGTAVPIILAQGNSCWIPRAEVHKLRTPHA